MTTEKAQNHQQTQEVLSAVAEGIKEGFALHAPSVPENVIQNIIDNAQYTLIEEVGGLTCYFSKFIINSLRNKKIKNEFTGNNVIKLAKKYRLSVQWIYKILKNEA